MDLFKLIKELMEKSTPLVNLFPHRRHFDRETIFFCVSRIDNTSSKENDATTPSSSDWWKGFLDAARNKVGAVLLVSMIERSTTLDLKLDGSIPDQSGLKINEMED